MKNSIPEEIKSSNEITRLNKIKNLDYSSKKFVVWDKRILNERLELDGRQEGHKNTKIQKYKNIINSNSLHSRRCLTIDVGLFII